MKALILAGGYATRMQPLTLNMAKPLLKVAGVPMVERILRQIEQVPNITEVFVCANNKFYNDFVTWSNSITSTKPLKILNDQTNSNEDRLGTTGNILFTIDHENIQDDLLVLAGDNLHDLCLKEFLSFFNKMNTSVVAAYDVTDEEIAKRMGILALDENQKINFFVEKPEEPPSTLAHTVIHAYKAEHFDHFRTYKEAGKPMDRIGDYIAWLKDQVDVHAVVHSGMWIDIGSLDQYEHANKLLAEKDAA